MDPLAATALRASNHHVHGCHMKQTCPEDKLDFLCPQCGLVLLQPSREHDSHLERHSDCSESSHSSDTGESVESLGEGRVYRNVPLSYFTHGWRIMRAVSRHPNLLLEDPLLQSTGEREQARTAECTCDLPTYGQYKGLFKLGIKSTCMHCTSSIEAGVLYGGYDAERSLLLEGIHCPPLIGRVRIARSLPWAHRSPVAGVHRRTYFQDAWGNPARSVSAASETLRGHS